MLSSRKGTEWKFPRAFICYTSVRCVHAKFLHVLVAGVQEWKAGNPRNAPSHPHVAGGALTSPPTIWVQSPCCVMNYFSDIRSANKKETIGVRYSLSLSINQNWWVCFNEMKDVWLIFSLSLYQLLYSLFIRLLQGSRENMTVLLFSRLVA